MKNQFTFWSKIAVAVLLSTLGVFLVVAANNNNERKIVGSWRATVTATNPPIGQFTELITFEDKGTVIESRRLYLPQSPFGPILETGGHGAWVKVGQREYQANFTFLVQGAPNNPTFNGQPLGTDNISLRLTISPDGENLTGTFQSQAKDEAGNTVFAVQGTYAATRIEAAP